eukprot:935434-Karenia_brevis.AAC.1
MVSHLVSAFEALLDPKSGRYRPPRTPDLAQIGHKATKKRSAPEYHNHVPANTHTNSLEKKKAWEQHPSPPPYRYITAAADARAGASA